MYIYVYVCTYAYTSMKVRMHIRVCILIHRYINCTAYANIPTVQVHIYIISQHVNNRTAFISCWPNTVQNRILVLYCCSKNCRIQNRNLLELYSIPYVPEDYRCFHLVLHKYEYQCVQSPPVMSDAHTYEYQCVLSSCPV